MLYFFIAAQIAQPLLFKRPGNMGNLGINKETQPHFILFVGIHM